MPTYNPKAIEPRWQQYWEEHKSFRTPDASDKPKYYILDMFPYPSGAGLHVGHPEGYTATDVLARYKRMRNFNVLHPMGWDAFGLPAEQYAIETGTHPAVTTNKNIDTFRRQIKSLGFSYDWDREISTTDPGYFKWTQWIFLQIFDTWYDPENRRGRPIAELPIPASVSAQGDPAIRAYRDSKRLAYQAEIPVNWCPYLGTVLANEEVVDGKSERGGHPVVRMPLRQWMLRITAYAERLLDDLAEVDWPEAIKEMQRNWIGKSEGAEVDFGIAGPASASGPIRVFTTRPDTLFGATYVVLAPEHPLVDKITTPEEKDAVKKYQAEAGRKSDMERTELAKEKTGVFTGAYAINPVNNEHIPIWIADYVLSTYGTGAIMAVPAHDERDFEFANRYTLRIRPVVVPTVGGERFRQIFLENFGTGKFTRFKNLFYRPYAPTENREVVTAELEERVRTKPDSERMLQVIEDPGSGVLVLSAGTWGYFGPGDIRSASQCVSLSAAFICEGVAVNSDEFDGRPTHEVKKRITSWLVGRGLGTAKINYKLRDWLFSRQRYWGEPFPILHEVDAQGKRTGGIEPLSAAELPLTLPPMDDFKPSGKPEPPLGKATAWLEVNRNGKSYRRETNTMPQWAGSCWYYLRYVDPKNDRVFCDPAKERAWMPVDLYVGGAEHAVLHLLYSRFWHKVLFDRGHVHTPEPFQRLVNQGMILGEAQPYVACDPDAGYDDDTAYEDLDPARLISADEVSQWNVHSELVLREDQIEEIAGKEYLKSKQRNDGKKIQIYKVAEKMSKSRGNVINPDRVVDEYGADSLRLYEMFMGPLEATKPWSMRGVEGVYRFLSRVWRLLIDDRGETLQPSESVTSAAPDAETLRKLHQTIQKVTEDLEAMRFNTAIAAMMEFTNHLTKLEARPRSAVETLVLLLAPFAPHLAEELWAVLGHAETLAYEPWPGFDESLTRAAEIEVPVQINGKLRGKIHVPADSDEATLIMVAQTDEKIQALLEGKKVIRVIAKQGRLVNFVVAGG